MRLMNQVRNSETSANSIDFSRRFDYVDSLRGSAILLVLTVHCVLASDGPMYFLIGQRGVQLFYIVSAYTLFLSLIERRTEKNFILNYTNGYSDRPTCAHSRIPIDLIVSGISMRLFQASQIASMIAS